MAKKHARKNYKHRESGHNAELFNDNVQHLERKNSYADHAHQDHIRPQEN